MTNRLLPKSDNGSAKRANLRRKWSTIPKAGWSLGYVSAIDSNGRTIWIADAHRDDESASLCVLTV